MTDRSELHLAYWRNRDPDLRSRLMMEYEGLARRLAARFSKRAEDFDDLMQVAMLGLLKALERFEPERGVQFTTFAWATIEGELKRHLRDRSWGMRVPRRLQEAYLRTSAALEQLTHELGRAPTVPELADITGQTEEELVEALEVRSASSLSSLDAPVQEDSELATIIGVEDADLGKVEELTWLEQMLDRLPERERTILHLRFNREMRQSEIGAQLGLSQMQISRILARVLTQLREWAEETTAGAVPRG